MVHKQPSAIPSHVQVRFELPACIWADRIFLVGDFNQWKTSITPLTQGRDGVWRAVLELPVGRQFAFRYWIDGKWQTDCKADGFVPDPMGKEASVVDTTIPSIPVKMIYASELSTIIKSGNLPMESVTPRDMLLS